MVCITFGLKHCGKLLNSSKNIKNCSLAVLWKMKGKIAIDIAVSYTHLFVCLGGTIVGILAGSLLHIGVTAGIVALLGLTIDIDVYKRQVLRPAFQTIPA